MDSIDVAINKIAVAYKVEPTDPIFGILRAVGDIYRAPGDKEASEVALKTSAMAAGLDASTERLTGCIGSLNQQLTALEIFRFRRTVALVGFGVLLGLSLMVFATFVFYRQSPLFKLSSRGITIESDNLSAVDSGTTVVRISGKTLKTAKKGTDSVYLEFSR